MSGGGSVIFLSHPPRHTIRWLVLAGEVIDLVIYLLLPAPII